MNKIYFLYILIYTLICYKDYYLLEVVWLVIKFLGIYIVLYVFVNMIFIHI